MKTSTLKFQFALEQAINEAKAYFKQAYEYYEIWEKYEHEVIIRAWDNTEDANYEFFSVKF